MEGGGAQCKSGDEQVPRGDAFQAERDVGYGPFLCGAGLCSAALSVVGAAEGWAPAVCWG